MKKNKKILAVILCASILAGMTACGENNSSNADDNSSTTTAALVTTTTEDDEIVNPVDVADITLDIGNENVDINGTVVKYIGTYDPTKAGDIKPAYVYFKENYGATIEVELAADADIMDKLATYLSTDSSPDLVDKRDNTFPYYITKNMYEPLDSYMDMSTPQWAGLDQFVEQYAINGKHYYYPWTYVISPKFMIYNRGAFEELGIDDPKELYDAGEWTWDTFYSCATQFVDKSGIEDSLGLYGALGSSFINSTGKAMVSYENGILVNNIRSTEVERAQNFLEKMRKEGISSLLYKEYSNVAHEPIIDGACAFQAVGDWKIADYSAVQNNNPDIDIFFVPFPRDPLADDYYQTLSTFGYMVPAGSKNIQASCIFINCVRMSITDEELAEKTKTSIMKQKKYTEEQYDFWYYFHDVNNFDSSTLVTDYSSSFDTNTYNDVIVPMLENIAFDMSGEELSWTVMRETYYSLVQDSLDNLNSFLS